MALYSKPISYDGDVRLTSTFDNARGYFSFLLDLFRHPEEGSDDNMCVVLSPMILVHFGHTGSIGVRQVSVEENNRLMLLHMLSQSLLLLAADVIDCAGPIPAALGGLTSLIALGFHINQLNGEWSSVGCLLLN